MNILSIYTKWRRKTKSDKIAMIETMQEMADRIVRLEKRNQDADIKAER